MFFDETVKISPEVPKAVTERISRAKTAYGNDDFLAFEAEWDGLECLIRSLLASDLIQAKDYNRIYEMFGKDWWNVDPSDSDVTVLTHGPGTATDAPVYERLAKSANVDSPSCR